METLLLDPSDVAASAHTPEVIVAVEEAFAAYQRGDVQMPAKSYIDLPQYAGDFRSMPAYMQADNWDAAAVKWVNSHRNNPDEHGLPAVIGTVIYSDPANAFPLSIMDGTTLTRRRTGAAAAVATDHLAVADAHSLGIIGAGVQSYTQLEAISEVRDIETVVVSDVREAAVERFIERFNEEFDVRAGDPADAADCDILSTVTPVEHPIVPAGAVREHTHINAMGADAPGKHELDDKLLESATIVIDDYEQCTHSGEINVPWSQGLLTDEDIYGELGAVVTDELAGRGEPGGPEGVTVFDSTGLAIQDVAAAHVVYERARDEDVGTDFELVGTKL
ncbi:ornithine cyclodeaminase family protein [Halosegnis sp.]|uniref:ornithine cyclodeaminase family protein n=1 Tax=Halosegnis sp. TaxID=2864959 RepID=UPI0035D3FB8C